MIGLMVLAMGFFYFVFSKYGAPNLNPADYNIYAKYLPWIFLSALVLVIFLFSEIEIQIDKGVNQIKIIKKKLWGRKKTQELQFDEVEKIVLREEISQQTNYHKKTRGAKSQTARYPLYFYLKGGEIGSEILIGGKNGSTFGNLGKNREIGKTIAEFIGKPFSEIRAPGLIEALEMGKSQWSKQIEKYKNK